MGTLVLLSATLVGVALAAVGLAATLDVLSIRRLLARLDAWWLLWAAQRLHGDLSHRWVQSLELALGLSGLALVGLVALVIVWRVARQKLPAG